MTDGSIRFLAGLSLAALAAITGIVSYLHALTVVYITGSAGLVAYLIPFVADLMIVTASLAILDAIRHHAPKPPLAMVSLVAGIGSTLAMNIVAGLHISAGGALVAALPPVAFVLSLETLMGIVRLARAGDGASHLTATDGQCPHQVAMSAEDAIVTAYLHARDCLGEPVSQRQLSATFGVPRPKVATLVGTLNGTRPNDAEEVVTERVSLTMSAAFLSAHRTMINGSAPCAAQMSRSVLAWLAPLGAEPHRTPSRFLSSRRVGNRRMRSEAPDLCTSCSPSWRCACAVRPCRTSSCLRLNRPLVPYRVGGGFIGASLDHAGQPLVPADGGDVARVCSSRSMHEPALPELVEHARGGAGPEAGRWCGWPTRSGSAREAQSRVAADGAVRRGAGSLLGACNRVCGRGRQRALVRVVLFAGADLGCS